MTQDLAVTELARQFYIAHGGAFVSAAAWRLMPDEVRAPWLSVARVAWTMGARP